MKQVSVSDFRKTMLQLATEDAAFEVVSRGKILFTVYPEDVAPPSRVTEVPFRPIAIPLESRHGVLQSRDEQNEAQKRRDAILNQITTRKRR